MPGKRFYTDTAHLADAVARGRHRELVGGLWEAMGRLQLAFLREQGLLPGHRLLDIGCGCLRGGVPLIDYLEPGHYCGLDSSAVLLEAGRTVELPAAGLGHKLPPENLRVSATFECEGFGRRFDVALAHSLFTHLPEAAIRLCLLKLKRVLAPKGRFFATIFEAPANHPSGAPLPHPCGVVSHDDQDPYHYRIDRLTALAGATGWRLLGHGTYGHPRDQRMLVLAPAPVPA